MIGVKNMSWRRNVNVNVRCCAALCVCRDWVRASESGRRCVAVMMAVVLVCVFSESLSAQRISDIKRDVSMVWGEGSAGDTRTADSLATEMLVGKIAEVMELPYSVAVKAALMET